MMSSARASSVVRSGWLTSKRARTEGAPGASTISSPMAVMSSARPTREGTRRAVSPFVRQPASRAGCSRVE